MRAINNIETLAALLLLILISPSSESPTIHPRNCCSVSRCREIPLNEEGHNVFQCFRKEICGEECSREQKTPAKTRYKRKNYYMKKICRLYQCDDYLVDCRRCPDPNRANFDVYNIDYDCINCYY